MSTKDDSLWRREGCWDKIQEILTKVKEAAPPEGLPKHHLVRPYMTSYQIAILFKEHFPDAFQRIGMPIGGSGGGDKLTLPQYFGGQLSWKCRVERDGELEGAFLISKCRPTFHYDSESVEASHTETAMFRLKK